MTRHYELIVSGPGNIYQQKIFAASTSSLSQKCENNKYVSGMQVEVI
jgi:hypothetical protein